MFENFVLKKINFLCQRWELFSVLQGDIRYQVTGNYPAPTFFDVNPVTGMIFLTRSVALDGLLTNNYFLKLIAYDTIYPNIQATATATINVNRNPNPPIFNPSTYRVTLSENHALGSAVVDVNATDADLVKITILVLLTVLIDDWFDHS